MFYRIARFVSLILLNIFYRVKIHSKVERTNDNEPLIICANHSSFLDPLFITISFKDDINFMGKKELFDNKFTNFLFRAIGGFPVDRDGNSLSAIKTSLRLLKNNHSLGIFPEGTRVTEYNEESIKGGTGMLAVKSNSNILPVYIDSSYKIFSKVDIYYGEKFNYNHLVKKELSSNDYTEISKDIMRHIYGLKTQNKGDVNGNS